VIEPRPVRTWGVSCQRMDHVRFLDHPALREPALICAFRGWNDGGEAASTAARYLAQRWDATLFALVDPEEFYDFQVNRPQVRLEQGGSRVIDWPRGELSAVTGRGRDAVLLIAPEPNVRWRTFADTIVAVARELRVGMVVSMGGFLTDVPHTRPVPVVGSAADERTAESLGLTPSQYEGPTGIVGVVHDAASRAGIPSASLWAAVPHYLPAAPNPKAALALVERASRLLGMAVDTAGLVAAAAAWEGEVLQLVQDSQELSDYVRRLEEAADQAMEALGEAGEPEPSAESIAAEVERYLRERGNPES
jgi:proteasome assembly chaperone (PAC2) family protein